MDKLDVIRTVKIQQSLSSPNHIKRVLVYDKERILFFESEDPEIVDTLANLLGERPKAYFEANIINTKLHVYNEIIGEDW